MCQRLDESGLVDYRPYDGVTLTEEGRAAAADLHETYVTLSWFFREILDLDDHEREAMEMAGIVSADVTDRLARTTLSDDTVPRSSGSEPQ
jgi:DtxR family Mn-dependent transcriptional regulator